MRTRFTFLCTLFLYNFAYSQTYVSNGGIILNFSNKYEEAEITYIDNTKKKGYINGFIENNSIDFSADGFEKFEESLNLDDKKFYFKNDLESESIILTQENIKSISIIANKEIKTYYLMKIKSVDKEFNVVDLNRKAWLPLLRDDVNIKIYGFNLFINNTYVYTYIYLSNDNEFAIKPVDRTVFNIEKTQISFKTMFRYVFNNCQKIEPLIDEFIDFEKSKEKYNELKTQIKSIKKDKKLSNEEVDLVILKLNENFYLEPYTNMIEEYDNSCK